MPAFVQDFALLPGAGLAVLTLAVTAYVLGRLLASRPGGAVERWAVPAALGVAAAAHLGLLLGFAGLLKPVPVLLALAGIHLLGFRVWRELPRELAALVRRSRPLWWLAGAAALLPLTLLPLYPPTAFDATLYHLPFARAFATSGGVPFLPDMRFPVFPQLNEVLFALLMLFAPDMAAHGVQWLMTMLTAALVWAWGREVFSSAAAGWLAAAAFLGNPIVVHLAGSAYVEAGLTLFTTAALYAAWRWRGTGERSWLVVSAVFAATAADTKYLGLFPVGVIGLAVLFGRVPERQARARTRDVLLFTGVAAALLAPWYGRIFAYTGNPLFPFFSWIFGHSGPWEPLRFRSHSGADPVEPAGSLLSYLGKLARLPWDLVFERSRYGAQPPFSPVYLAMLPIALLAALRDSRLLRLLAVAAAYVLACFALPADSRYMVPALPLVSLAVAGAAVQLLGRSPGRFLGGQRRLLAAGLCAGFLLPGWLYGFYRAHREGPIPLTPGQREAYLVRRVPLYPAVAYLNRTRGSGYTVWALHAEHMLYYARGRFLGDWIGPASFRLVLKDLAGSEDLYRRLRRHGADHFLVVKGQQELEFSEGADFERWFRKVYEDSRARVYRLRGEED
ncbi:MAG TPA: glycosyltransferase family 39 protein [Thermoanaerobaculia bacterium]|nr:glycosyltransferase family 39 protein [Thermoanaerobaculia bacterium]